MVLVAERQVPFGKIRGELEGPVGRLSGASSTGLRAVEVKVVGETVRHRQLGVGQGEVGIDARGLGQELDRHIGIVLGGKLVGPHQILGAAQVRLVRLDAVRAAPRRRRPLRLQFLFLND